MSWDMWHVYGSGIDLSDVDEGKYKNFILSHEQSLLDSDFRYAKSLIDFLNETAAEDINRFYDIADMTDTMSISEPVASIMTQETGIRFDYPGITDDGEDCLLFTACDPWVYNEIEKELTQEKLFAILKKYADELGVNVNMDIDLIYSG